MQSKGIKTGLTCAWALLCLWSCESGTDLVPIPAMELEGHIRYEARLPAELGASDPPELRPARFVDVEVVNNDGEIIASTPTDHEGRFTLDLPAGGVKLIAWARVNDQGHQIAVTTDADGHHPHRYEVILSEATLPLDQVIPDDSGPAGAFHIVDTMVIGLERAEAWTMREMPPIFLYWGRGVTTSWSFFHGERPSGSGRYGFEILGGQPGAYRTTDTDEHDEVILLHELGHLVMTLESTDSSFGGPHPPGVLVDPGLAWEEGRVSWFAAAIMNDPKYRDTVGVEPEGSLRVDLDFSGIHDGPQSIGSERTVSEVLWELTDGTENVNDDDDDDGVSLGPVGLLEAMIDLRSEEGAYPCLSSFLWFLIRSDRVEEAALREMLSRSGHPPELLPTTETDLWPIDISLPAVVEGTIDGLTDPAPSGGEAHPETGLDATETYRFQLSRSTEIELLLTIDGEGTADDHSDLDLDLRDIRAQLLSRASTEQSVERIGPTTLEEGWYIVVVRDGGDGSRAHYQLSLQDVQ